MVADFKTIVEIKKIEVAEFPMYIGVVVQVDMVDNSHTLVDRVIHNQPKDFLSFICDYVSSSKALKMIEYLEANEVLYFTEEW